MIRALRVILKTLAIAVAIAAALLHFAALRVIRRPTLQQRAAWLRTWCKVALTIMRIRIACRGELPVSGLLVSNHLSYLDILVYGTLAPAIFVSKIEVNSWPLVGLMARLGGAIFTDRRRWRQIPKTVGEVEQALHAGALVVIFPEATTTDGSQILPFRPALFEAAVRAHATIRAAHIWYTDSAGSFARDLCWFGEVNGAAHLACAFAQKAITAQVTVASGSRFFDVPKLAAAAMYREVSELGSANVETLEEPPKISGSRRLAGTAPHP